MLHRLFKLSTISFDQRRYMRDLKQLSSIVDIKPEILDALMNKRPVVALESTIITHGMPHPHNIDTAIEVEKIVREQGAVPATVAILKGRIKIGLSRNELLELADGKTEVIKTSRRDIPFVLGKQLNGGTTVASTVLFAKLTGIKVFATGGIGGVHRNGENTMDVSADLVEMGRSPVVVVSSGIKSILDIPRTMEYLETQGVCVSTFQVPDKEFPAFYTRQSGVKAPYNFADALDAAKCIDKAFQLGLESGILIGVPVPEEQAMNDAVISNSINNALAEAAKAGIKGKEVTPFILAAVSKITSGKSLQTNIALIKNNAKVAAEIIVALEQLQKDDDEQRKERLHAVKNIENASIGAPVVVGGSILDVHYRVLEENFETEKEKTEKDDEYEVAEAEEHPLRTIALPRYVLYKTLRRFLCKRRTYACETPTSFNFIFNDNLKLNGGTYKSETKFSGGGVGRNIAEGLHKLHGAVSLISAFGKDQNGDFLRKTLPDKATGGSKISDIYPTANCAVILDRNGDMKLVVGDMTIHREITPDLIYKSASLIERSPLVCIDSNLSLEAIEATLLLAKRLHKPVFYEPTDMSIAGKPYELDRKCYEQIKFISPNLYELRKIADTLRVPPAMKGNSKLEVVKADDDEKKRDVLSEISELCDKLQEHIDTIIVTAGSLGVFVQRTRGIEESFFTNDLTYVSTYLEGGAGHKSCRYYPGKAVDKIVNASGAGDAFCAGFIAGMLKHQPEDICVSVGFEAAIAALMSKRAVPKTFFDLSHQCWRTSAQFQLPKDF